MKTWIVLSLAAGWAMATAATIADPPVYEKYDGRRGPTALDGERVGEAMEHLANADDADTADNAFLSLFSREFNEEPPPLPSPNPKPPISDADASIPANDTSVDADSGRAGDGDADHAADQALGRSPASDRPTPFDM